MSFRSILKDVITDEKAWHKMEQFVEMATGNKTIRMVLSECTVNEDVYNAPNYCGRLNIIIRH